jgi:hypothetical protein
VVAIFIVACVGFGFGLVVFSRPLMGLLGFAMILGSTMDQWLGSTYSVDSRGARSRVGPSVSEMRWDQLIRVTVSDKGVRLSPLKTAGHLDAFRGVILRTTAENHADVIEFVRERCPEGVSFDSATLEAN